MVFSEHLEMKKGGKELRLNMECMDEEDLRNLRLPGKMRLVPKKNKPTKLKEKMLEERERRREKEDRNGNLWCQKGIPTVSVSELTSSCESPGGSCCGPEHGMGQANILGFEIQKLGEKLRELDNPTLVEPQAPPPPSLWLEEKVGQKYSEDLGAQIVEMVSELERFQKRAKELQPQKMSRLRRYVLGLKETEKFMKKQQIQGIIVANNIEATPGEEDSGGITTQVLHLLSLAASTSVKGLGGREEHREPVPVVIGPSKAKLKKALGSSMKQSVIGLLSVEGQNQQWKKILRETQHC